MADCVADGTSNKGDRNPSAKLTEVQVVEIRHRYASGSISLRALADEYGVAKTLVYDIVRGELWTHVGGPIKGVDYSTNDKRKLAAASQ